MKIAALLLALLVVACGDGVDGPTATASPVLDEAHPYVLLDDPPWQLREAVDYAADHPFTTLGRGTLPSVDWYAEYDHDPVTLPGDVLRVDHVKVSAVDGSLERTAEQYAALGGPSEPLAHGEWVGRRGFDRGDLDAFLLLDGGDRTVVIDSPDLTVDELVALLDELEPVDDAGWAEAGGVDLG